MLDRLALAHQLIDEDPDAAQGLCKEVLNDDPNEARALYILGILMTRAERYGMAIAYLERVCHLNNRHEAWHALGTAWHELGYAQKAREYFRRANEMKERALYVCSIGATYALEGNHQEALKWARKAEKMDPDLQMAKITQGFSELALGDWASGWKHYESHLGLKHRKKLNFGPDWDGSPVNRLIVYGEQGLGDEIMFASIFDDLRGRANEIVIECDPRLEGLYKRSFPWAEVHGTRRLDREWNTQCDAQVAVGSLPSLFRPSPDSCPKKPYLVADPEKRLMWRALFDSWKKPVIGICWSGGRITSQEKARRVGLDSFRELIENTDAAFVSLEYKDPSAEIEESGLPVRWFKQTLQGEDYDETAAIVAELDYLIGPPTTVHHLAGALGKPSLILVNEHPMWNFYSGDRLPWNAEQIFHRQKPGESWPDCVNRVDIKGIKWTR